MPTFAAFLRGMNLGRRRVTNDELCDAFRGLGFEGVTAFLASGNVVFSTEETSRDRLEAVLEEGLGEAFDYEVPTFVRTADEVLGIAAAEPFARELVEGRGKIQVALLPKPPSEAAAGDALTFASEEDRLALDGTELYWLPKAGILDATIDLAAVEKLIGPWTVRTHRTLQRLTAKL